MRFVILAALLAVSPCATRGDSSRSEAQGASAQAQEAPASRPVPTANTPTPEVALSIVPRPVVTPIDAKMVETMRAIVATRPETRADVFSKMGGSSVVNRGFLHCFAEEQTVDFGEHDLGESLAYFRAARIGRTTSFDRTSLAAEVGWSLRQALSGRRPPAIQEVIATDARYALVFFGSNDVEGKNAHQFIGRLDRMVSALAERGVVPILGATYPRRANDREMNEQVRRYNRMSFALAAARGLPYIDFHQAMMPLPGRGLAADGYHPNSYVVGPRSRACDFGSAGMAFGNNHRNLLTMTALDAVRRALDENAEPVASAAPLHGAGTLEDPTRLRTLPFARRFDLEAVPTETASLAETCAAGTGEGRAFAARFVLENATRMRFSAVAMGPVETFLALRRADGTCVAAGDHEQVRSLEPGPYELVAFARASRRVPEDQLGLSPRMLVVVDNEP